MKAGRVLSILGLGLFAWGATAHEVRAAPIGCMKCHGDEAAMKSMVKPVVQASSEGEG